MEYCARFEATIVSTVINRIYEIHPQEQINKTLLQNIIYLLESDNIIDLNYTIYQYGPHSTVVDNEINLLKNTGFIDMEWMDNKGYNIKLIKKLEFSSVNDQQLINKINKITEFVSGYNVLQTTIIAFSSYIINILKTNDVNEIAKKIKKIIFNTDIDEITKIINDYLFFKQNFNAEINNQHLSN